MQTEHDVGHDEASDPFQFSLPAGCCAQRRQVSTENERESGGHVHQQVAVA